MKKNKYADLKIIDTYSVNLWEDGYIIRDGRPYQPDYTHLAEDPSGNRYAVKLKPWNGKISHALPVKLSRDVLESIARDLNLEGYSLEDWDINCIDWLDRDPASYEELQLCEVQEVNKILYWIQHSTWILISMGSIGWDYSPTESNDIDRLIFRDADEPKVKVKVFESWQEADMYYESLSD